MIKNLLALAATISLYSSSSCRVCDDIFYDDRPNPKPKQDTQPESYLDELDKKGLQEYNIQGEIIIAHNHDEAWKRYNHRRKKRYE